MWQRFTEQAKRIVFFAQEEAGKRGSDQVGPEHMLLGILRVDESIAVKILKAMSIDAEALGTNFRQIVPIGPGRSKVDMLLTAEAKRVIDLSYEEARRLDSIYIGTEHLLLGLIRDESGIAGQALSKTGVQLSVARAFVAAPEDISSSIKSWQLASVDLDEKSSQGNPEGRFTESARQMEQRLAQLREQAFDEAPRTAPDDVDPAPILGDLGFASPPSDRMLIEVAHDAAAFRRLIAAFLAKDAYGYRTLTEGDQTVFVLPARTQLKLLVPPPDAEDVFETGYYVRVLSGDYAGYAGWIFKEAFERTGSDDAAFPPEEA